MLKCKQIEQNIHNNVSVLFKITEYTFALYKNIETINGLESVWACLKPKTFHANLPIQIDICI